MANSVTRCLSRWQVQRWCRLGWPLWIIACFAIGRFTMPPIVQEARDPWPAAAKPHYLLRWKGWDDSLQWATFALTVTNESKAQQLTVPAVYDGIFGPNDFRSRNFRTWIKMDLHCNGVDWSVGGQRGPRGNYLLDYGTLITLPPGGSLTGHVRIRYANVVEKIALEHGGLNSGTNCLHATVYVEQLMTTPDMAHSHPAQHVWQGEYRTTPILVPPLARHKGEQ